MPKSRPPYPPEFRQRIIELIRKGRTRESLAEQFEPSAQTIRNWLAQAERDAGQRTDGLTTDEREELRRLRRENKALTCFLAAAHGRHIQALGFCLRRSTNACSAG
jgi:transposase